jgi:Predicted NADH:ubiquinone oxidoreductase, subunit RnfG
VSRLGQLVYGCLIGVLGALFRIFGKSADSFSYSIIIANLFTPLIDLYIVPKPYAYRKRAVEKAAGVQKPPFFKRIPKPVIALTIIAALAGVALSGVFSMTKGPIESNELAKKRQSYTVVCENAADFREIPAADEAIAALNGASYGGGKFGATTIDEALEAVDANGNVCGYVFAVTNRNAYNPPLKLALGVDPEGKVLSIAFIELSETPGKGSLADEPTFKAQFAGKQADSFILNGGGDNGIDAITGATVTTKAVLNAVNAGLDFFRNVIMKGGN